MKQNPVRWTGYVWVGTQAVLLGAIGLVQPDQLSVPAIVSTIGIILIVAGLLIAGVSAFQLGHSLSVFPAPVPDGSLITTGLFGLVRHPIYTGVILAAVGWSLSRSSLIGMALCVVLFLFFDRKAAYEERQLAVQFPDYAAYRARTCKLIPVLY